MSGWRVGVGAAGRERVGGRVVDAGAMVGGGVRLAGSWVARRGVPGMKGGWEEGGSGVLHCCC